MAKAEEVVKYLAEELKIAYWSRNSSGLPDDEIFKLNVERVLTERGLVEVGKALEELNRELNSPVRDALLIRVRAKQAGDAWAKLTGEK